MKLKTSCALLALSSSLFLSGCMNNADQYAADVYNPTQLNQKQESKTVNIISILPAKVAVDNKENKEMAQTVGTILGTVAGAAGGYNLGHGSKAGAVAGGAAGAATGAAAGSLVKDKVLVHGVSLTYKEGSKIYTSTQVGETCQFQPGIALVISMEQGETRIQPNAACPKKS